MAKSAPPLVVRRRVDLDELDGNVDDRYVVMAAPPPPDEGGAVYLIAGLLVGAVIGAAVGLVLAPRSGEATRQQLLNRLPGGLGEAVAEEAAAAVAAVEQAAPPLSPSNATAAGLDPVAQVTQYQAPPVPAGPGPYQTDAAPPASRPTP